MAPVRTSPSGCSSSGSALVRFSYRAASNACLHFDFAFFPRRGTESSRDVSHLLDTQWLACSPLPPPGRRSFLRRLARRMARWARSFLDALLVAGRAAEIAALTSPLLVLGPISWASSRLLGPLSAPSDVAWSYALFTLQALGPAFVKLAQWAGTRRDLLPHAVCDRLSELNDRARIHSWSHTHRILAESFGDDYRTRGIDLDASSEVIGSGSVAQVYRATLVEQGRPGRAVAVKVLHPNIAGRVERDLALMTRVASLLDSIPLAAIRMLSLPRAADNFASVLRSQVDLRMEGNNLLRFRDNFTYNRRGRSLLDWLLGKEDGGSSTDPPSSAVHFPSPIQDWTSRDVLVETYVGDARPISDFLHDESERGMEIRKQLAAPLLRSFLKMVFIDNFTHCDLHAGNVLVQQKKDGTAGRYQYTICFLDAGLTVSLPPNDVRNLIDLFRAVILNDGEEAGRLMVERARYETCSKVEGGVEAFSTGVGEIVSEFHDRRKNGLTLGAVGIGSLLGSVLDLCRIHGVEIDPAMANIVVSTIVLEGLGRSLHPDLNLLEFAMPFVLGRGKV